MDRAPNDPLADLRLNTLTWIVVLIWLVWGYLGQSPPGGSYTEGLRGIFVAILAVIIQVVSLAIVTAWILALRERRRERENQ